MRAVPFRRPLALLVATAVLSSAGVASGMLTGVAHAAVPESLTVDPVFARNTDTSVTPLTFTTDGTPFPPGATITLLHSNGTDRISQAGPPQVDPQNSKRQTVNFDLRQQAPGLYGAEIGPPASSATYKCTSCFTVTGFQPTVTGIARKSGNPPAAGFFTVSGSNFARAMKVTFEQAGVTDTGVTFTAAPAGPAAPTGGDPNNPSGQNPTSYQVIGSVAVNANAKGGAYDIVVTNTDGKVATCTGCFTIPRIDQVFRSDKSAGVPAELGYGVANKDLVVQGVGILATTKVAIYPTGNYTGTNNVTVNSITPAADGKSAVVNVTTTDPSSAPTGSALYDLTLYNPEGGYETNADALTLNPRPTFGANPVDLNNPGVSAKKVPLTLRGSYFQPGMTVAFTPSTGITVNSITQVAGGAEVEVDIAASAPLTARTIAVTNPDFGTSPADSDATITPSAAPVVTSFTPTSVSAGTTSVSLTVHGSGFGRQSISQNGGLPSTSTSYIDPKIVFLKPDGTIDTAYAQQGSVSTPQDANGNYTTATATISIPAGAPAGPRRVGYRDKNHSLVECVTPTGGVCFNIDSLGVTSVSPTFDTNDGTKTITITGSGFELGAVPKLERSGQADIVGSNVQVLSSTSITASFDLLYAPPGTNAWSMRVTNPNSSTGIKRNSYSISGPAPVLTSVSPSSVPAGKPATVLTLKGTGFARGATLTFSSCGTSNSCNPRVISSELVDGSTYEFTIDTTGSSVGLRTLTLTNTDGSATPTCLTCTFQVTSAPTISSTNGVSPSSRSAGAAVTDVTIRGTGFNGSPTAAFSGTGITVGTAKSVTPTSFVIPVTVADSAELTTRDVTVTNGDGATASCLQCFTVKAAPTVTSIAPAATLRGTPALSPVTVTVKGTGFATSGVTLDLGPGVTVTGATATDASTITASVNVAANAAPRGARDVVVTNTAAAEGGTATLPLGFTVADAPSQPLSLAGTGSDKAVDLTWAAPADDGGLPVTRYDVTVTKTADGSAVTPTISYQGTTAHVAGLVNGTPYTFVVKAQNAVATGPASNSVSVKPHTVPDPPTIGAAAAGPGSATVTFSPPAFNGGEPITSYRATSSPSGFTGTATSSPITVTGLTNGVTYRFSVVAINVVGESGPSASSNAVTPVAPTPTAPSNLAASVTRAPGTADLTWSAPTSPPGPITSYTVSITPAGGTVTYPAQRSTTGAVVTGLTNGTQYAFRVVANGSSGASPVSNTALATPYDVPASVRALTGSRNMSNGIGTVTWNAPAFNGGSPITGYVMTVTPSAGTAVVYPADRTQTGATVTGLSAGTDYYVSVVAQNLRGAGPALAFGPLREITVPGAPGTPHATGGDGRATVSWTAPASDGGSAITSYTVTSSPGGITATGSGSPLTVTGLTNETAYTFTVRATNQVGAGPASAASNSVTPSAVVVPTFKLGTNVIAAGQFTKVVVNGTPNDTVQVLVKGAASSTYTVIGNLTVNSAGVAALAISPSTTSSYYVRNAKGDAAVRSLLVKAVQSLAVKASGRTGIFAGHVAPSLVGRTVIVYYYVTGGHVQVACTTKVVSGGQFRCTKVFPAGLLIHAFAQTGADKYNAAGRSAVKDLRIGR